MISRRSLLGGAAAGTMALGLAACSNGGGGEPGEPVDGAGKSLTLWIMQGTNSKSDEYIAALKDAFTTQTGAELTVEVQPWDGAHDKFVTAMTGGTGPDVAEVGTTWTPEFADAGGLDLLTDDIEAAGLGDDLVDGLVEAATLDGDIYGMPWYAGVRSILGNRELLDAAGVNEQPQNWDDLFEMIQALKGQDANTIPFPVAGASLFAMMPFPWGAGGDIATESGGNWTAAINQAPAVEGIKWYTDLALVHGASTPAASTWKETDSLKQFEQGNVGMFITGSWVPATIKQNQPDLYEQLVAFTIPGKDSAIAPSFLGGSHLCRFADTEEPELSFELIKLMSTGEFAERWATETNYFPGQKSALEAVTAAGDELTTVFASQMNEGGTSVPVTPLWGQVEGRKTLPNMLNNILAGGQDAQTAADAAAEEMNAIFGG
ncbi:extracellular solute-binding protein [Parenemella sanctibonifatiensis]|uniref:Sugar ABC transporter substrate-binding protein n=1 Tax=Parenemella sanctibonifatiensis TaxID=2016505 RepID=A0A255EAX6_9ACTN|nr:extracellular solute-binding protein [Parenemella sanctibonifatiensis]OYN88676.1 sugar ABC transporter substrate-binding protein [Parenemella sanctibonifatiensis]OYN88898.1 sugar ABC transporter substrate-binding protein [Parenemella sanctibonifatiensis]